MAKSSRHSFVTNITSFKKLPFFFLYYIE